MRTRQADEAGFTLVEMLVSLALLGVAALLMVQGFSASRGAWRRMTARESASEAIAVAETRLRAGLEQIVVRARFEKDTPYIDLDGGPRQLDFLSAPPLGEPPGAVERRRLSLTSDGDLQLQAMDIHGEPGGAPDTLLRHVAGLQIGYFDPSGAGAGAGGGWRDDWSGQPVPPTLVRVRVDFPPGDRRVWPELMARPAATVDAQCVIDGDTGACRGRT